MTQQPTLPLPTVAFATPTIPDPDTCWQAVQRRDRGYNGRFWFSVRTTGVYCLPSCAARRPLRRNVAFHASPEAAEAAGFRACKRCKPRDWQAGVGLSRPVARACALFDAEATDTPPTLAEVARRVGLSSGALSKRFVAELGVNPRDWLTARKRQRFRKALRAGERVAEALYGAGYGSPSRVYETSDKALGMTPATYAKGGAGAHIDYTTVDSRYNCILSHNQSETEEFVRARGGVVARLAGIYGPGRSALLRKFLGGEAVLDPAGDRFVNQVHRDDIASALLLLLKRNRETTLPGEGSSARIFNVSDNHPATQRECYEWLASNLDRPVPPRGAAPAKRKRGESNKRVSSTRLQALGWSPRYPTFQVAMRESILPALGLTIA